ncbi:hypothetical protein ACIP4W_40865, partial [Streptomyces sp. NPDC088846]|uniref:hypothetical protein n=1 Tax=Streptomyces sp. NPDC088846 TaxID=3365908 RepID=UPI0038281930
QPPGRGEDGCPSGSGCVVDFRPNLLAAAPNTPPVTAPTAVAFAAPLALQPSSLVTHETP